MSILPLVVDLDGTLIHTDMLHESAVQRIKKKPLGFLKLFYWLFKGKANLKTQLAHRSTIDYTALPYHQALLDWLVVQKKSGRPLILCTASNVRFAEGIAAHLGVFDDVIASNLSHHLSGKNKAHLLVERFGDAGFDYVGNSSDDILVWKYARRAILVNTSRKITQKVQVFCEIEAHFPRIKPTIAMVHKVLRTHQWIKNLLLFVPLLAAHQFTNASTWLTLVIAFFAFSFCASSVYIMNDLFDLESDRQHPQKRHRPFASGKVPVWVGVLLAPCLLFASLGVAAFVGVNFSKCVLIYFLMTCAYSWGLKRLVLVDCMTLAMLYTMRIISGAMASHQTVTFWLLAFSVFLFVSLAFVKRYVELMGKVEKNNTKILGRGYHTEDAPLIQVFGVAAGYTSVLILALYFNSDAVSHLYQFSEYVWGTVPLMLFWVSWVWLQTHRGKMHDDPVIFALKDRTSLFTGLLFFVLLVLGAVGRL